MFRTIITSAIIAFTAIAPVAPSSER